MTIMGQSSPSAMMIMPLAPCGVHNRSKLFVVQGRELLASMESIVENVVARCMSLGSEAAALVQFGSLRIGRLEQLLSLGALVVPLVHVLVIQFGKVRANVVLVSCRCCHSFGTNRNLAHHVVVSFPTSKQNALRRIFHHCLPAMFQHA